MSNRKGGIGPLDPIYDVETQYGAISVGATPAGGVIPVTVEEQAGQTDPVVGDPVFYDVLFAESVSGFVPADMTLLGTAGATTVALTGAGAAYVAEVTGMTVAGTVIAKVLPGKVTGDVSGDTNRTSTSIDNIVNWEPYPLPPWSDYWDFSNTANWGGSVAVGQLAETGSLFMKQIDFPNGMGLSTINGLTAATNTPVFLAGRGEWGTDASVAAITVPYGIGIVYQANDVGTTSSGAVMALSVSNDPSGQLKPQINSGDPDSGGQVSVTTGGGSLTSATAPGDYNPHVAFVYVDTGANSKLYVDGVLEATGSLGLGALSAGARVIFIGTNIADGGGATSGQATTGWKVSEGGLSVGVTTDLMITNWMADMIAKWGI